MTGLKIKSLAFFIFGLMIFLMIVYWGLNTVEKGIQHVLALESTAQALQFELTEEGFLLTFAGRRFSLHLPFLLVIFYF